ncbi:MAG: radical SAM protein [Spirochaetota bacterium]
MLYKDWQDELRDASRNSKALASSGLCPENLAEAAELPARSGLLPFALTPTIMKGIRDRGSSFCADDPVAAQFLPTKDELLRLPWEESDPLSETGFAGALGLERRLVRQYPSRALVRATTECAAYCRFCYRRSIMDIDRGYVTGAELEAIGTALRGMSGLREILVSGGDPLVASDRKVGTLLSTLRKAVPGVSIRICTRTPIVLPARITPGLVELARTGGPTWFVVHVNHPAELGVEAEGAFHRLIQAGLPVASQTVLLKGINDDPDILERLFSRILSLGAKPYYLFQGDLAAGTSHFRVPLSRGLGIYAQLRSRLSGLELPRYAVDVPGGLGKAYLPEDIAERTEDGWLLRVASGKTGWYPEEA